MHYVIEYSKLYKNLCMSDVSSSVYHISHDAFTIIFLKIMSRRIKVSV